MIKILILSVMITLLIDSPIFLKASNRLYGEYLSGKFIDMEKRI